MLIWRCPNEGPLLDVVERIWCVTDSTAKGFETVLPSGKAQIILSLSGLALATHDPCCDAAPSGSFQVFQGPSSRPRRIARDPQVALCGVSFHPGGAAALIDRIDLTADRVLPLGRYWGAEAARLREGLRQRDGHHARLDLLTAEILRRLHSPPGAETVRRGLQCLMSGASVTETCAELGCSPYMFRTLFRRQVGFTPKHFLRIERFRQAARGLLSSDPLAEIAYDADFADQSHMTREVEHFAAMTPGRLRARPRTHPGHVPEDQI
ncbi:helix-turn-helix domain-containing protein [Sulfitobacter sp. G21635-S1]|uniref:helix-turn-helix domain-containing protein n=1 Tax=Sulfitobacter sp. G21635-S1 TaxID=3014043 RepID=UPI002F356390